MRLIKLTEEKVIPQRDGNNHVIGIHKVYEARYFNVDKIENFSRLKNTTYLYMSTSSAAFVVVEPPEEIIQLIEQAKEI
ncbi:hypothetical protein CIRMBP1239_00049 [Enterococcus cecorum]|uniref:hypothetical protein n=1 Tax=Enterococcus cecorum TaxID=44008 RepID=UPI0022D497B0|nr:hypothetical protein [Enterococcus cecorum]CAI3253506.1 hypothetical protein CIRMBP1223_00049 [Enterococcus cecorum]CAI3254915.1 hypothetical protein CIRMBP1239_00049 [Enterococcus cecorum]CAI3259947.1 hypothetical protein CIRMBP1252_00143 [Enterococcus cecorum]CAI3262222.1 hypothetical protein CIRMBP1260_00144 [Enterococcus cecorum]CAI3263032.1 hypothetical protein CIRMBP1211_00142 [Enterococcus cecorum]